MTAEIAPERLRDRADRRVDLGLRERPVRRLEGEPKREALLVGSEWRAAIDVEQGGIAEQRTRSRGDDLSNARRSVVLREDDGDVALDSWEARHRRCHDTPKLAARQAGDRELPHDDPLGPQIEALDERRMDLAQSTRDGHSSRCRRASVPGGGPSRVAGHQHARGSARMERRVTGERHVLRASEPEVPAEKLDEPLPIIEIPRPGGPARMRRPDGSGQGEPEPPPFGRRLGSTH